MTDPLPSPALPSTPQAAEADGVLSAERVKEYQTAKGYRDGFAVGVDDEPLEVVEVVASSLRALADSHERLRLLLAEARAEKEKAQRTADIRQRMIDIPTAWELTLATDKEQHHEKCSYRVAGMLCDCAACRVMERVSGLLRALSERAERAERALTAAQGEIAGLRAALEETVQVVEAEHLNDPNPDSDGDKAYDLAVNHCADAVRYHLKIVLAPESERTHE